MSPPNEQEQAFIAYLEGLAKSADRGALAALRRGLGKPPGEAPEAYPYVIPWLGKEAKPWSDEPYYLASALFAYWHQGTAGRSASPPEDLGDSFARLREGSGDEGIERRFVALLNSHRDDLPHHLRQAVGLFKSKDVPVNWARLLHDLKAWDWENRPVQQSWARSFWSRHAKGAAETTNAVATAPS